MAVQVQRSFTLSLIALCLSITPILSRSLNDISESIDLPVGPGLPKDISCFMNNGQTAMIGDTPHFFDCNRYYTCVNGEFGRPVPLLRECQTGHQGTLLFYDFRNCRCEIRDNAKCFDWSSDEDHNDRFICAGPANRNNTDLNV